VIVDVQVHIFRRIGKDPVWNPSYPPEMLIGLMDGAGVDKAILISYEPQDILPDLGGDPLKVDVDKGYFIGAYRRYPGRFIWFSDGVDPRKRDWMERVEEDIDRGVRGIKMFPAYVSTLPGDPRYDRLYRRCADLGLPIIMAFERWNDPGLGACMRDYRRFLRKFEPVAERFSNVDFLLTHWGCFNWCDRRPVSSKPPFPGLEHLLELLKRHGNLYTDIAAIAPDIGGANEEEWPWPTALKLIERIVREAGIEKVMYGTDWPWTEGYCTYGQMVTMITKGATFLDEQEKQQLLGGNAARFLGLKG
jgi:predicted TIM-barrel fold metal-dependent hydrolase